MLKQALIIASYGLLAVAVGLVSPEFAPALAPPASWIAAGVVFLGGALAHEAHVRASQRATLAGQIFALRSENTALSEQAINFREVLEELDAGGSDKSKEDLDRVVSEVRVLQNLIGQLSAIRSSAAKISMPGEAKADAKADTKADTNAETPVDGEAQPRGDGTVYGLDEIEVLNIVREGLRNERVDLYLQPIVSLPQRKTRFYECFSRIRAEDGTIIRPDQYIELAKKEGLMGAIDNMLLFRCVQLIRKVQGNSAKVGFFCNISANTLTDKKFFSDFVNFMAANTSLARNLIFEFSQTDLDTHRQEIGEYAARLGELGFNFSLDQVVDLTKLNLEVLAALGFRYIKVDGQNLLEMPREKNTPAPIKDVGAGGLDTMVKAEDEADTDTVVGIDVALLKRTMDIQGIDLIVEKLEQEQDLIELLEFRIDYGQGYLFGEPRLSK